MEYKGVSVKTPVKASNTMDRNDESGYAENDLPIQSQALAANIAECPTHDSIDQRFMVLYDVISDYAGLVETTHAFLCELSHPLKNYGFILEGAKSYGLKNLHLLRSDPDGPQASRVLTDIFLDAASNAKTVNLKSDAIDGLLLFLQNLSKELKGDSDPFAPAVKYGFSRILDLPDDDFLLVVTSFYQVQKAIKAYVTAGDDNSGDGVCSRLLIRYFRQVFDYWLSQEDPRTWLEQASGSPVADEHQAELFQPVSHATAEKYWTTLNGLVAKEDPGRLTALLDLPGFGSWVSEYRNLAQRLAPASGASPTETYQKLLLHFFIIDNPGLSRIHEEMLRELNKPLDSLIANQDPNEVKILLGKTFDILEQIRDQYPQAALDCIQRMGQEIYQTSDSDLMDFFLKRTIGFGFQYPRISGMTEDWQVLANAAHLKNIRVWLDLICLDPSRSRKLISALVVNLALGGMFVRDTDLFPREVTELLNADIGPVYNLIKQLARVFPVYFNEIGAEGQLRDISTEMDELFHRDDKLVHFLRKQSHVESSNLTVALAKGVLTFWHTLDKTPLQGLLPPSTYEWVQDQGRFVQGAHAIMAELLSGYGLDSVPDLLDMDHQVIENRIGKIRDVPVEDKQRVERAIRLYRLLYQKYNLGFQDFEEQLKTYETIGFPKVPQLLRGLKKRSLTARLDAILSYQKVLKDIILSPETFQPVEDIYRKRHIAVDIPSMYGRYHERKFDALSLTFRLENLANVLFEEVVGSVNLSLITRSTVFHIFDCLKLFQRALALDGIISREMDYQMDMLVHALKEREFTLSQYIDLFNGLSEAIKKILDIYYHSDYAENLEFIVSRIDVQEFLPKYMKNLRDHARSQLEQAVIEHFLRDLIAGALGLQQLDLFINRIRNTLYAQADKVDSSKTRVLLSYNPDRAICPIYKPKRGVDDIIHLGNKGYNLVRLAALGQPVPPGFIVTTEVFRCREILDKYAPATEDFKRKVAQAIDALQKKAGRGFGDPANPLLVSVRSGAAVSQPGMMETLLNVGMNTKVAQGFADAAGNGWLAWDSYRRFLQGWGMQHGLARDQFDKVINDFKRTKGTEFKGDFTPDEMRELALQYRRLLEEHNVSIIDEPMDQLYAAISRVMKSWDAPRARTYRKIMGISDNWGTAVIVQQMVFGNMSSQSGAGVIFTHSPSLPSDRIRLWGDFAIGDQGEDVVSGLVRTMPISRLQAEMEVRTDSSSLEEMFPYVYKAALSTVYELVQNQGWGPQDLEFTFEGPAEQDFYLLQARDLGLQERKAEAVFDPSETALEGRLLCRGLGVSGGALSGRIVFTLDEIDYWHDKEPHTPLILMRTDTVPDDIKEISAADGLLTARGGSTSHASIVAHRLGKTCVVGCSRMWCHEEDQFCTVGDRTLHSGDEISINGRSGEIYLGRIAVHTPEVREAG